MKRRRYRVIEKQPEKEEIKGEQVNPIPLFCCLKNIYIFTHGQFIAATKIVYNNMEKSDLEIMKLFFEEKRGLTISNCEIVEL